MRRHLALNLEFYGPEAGLILFRKHAAKYIHGLPGEAQLRIPLLTAATVNEFDSLIGGLEAGGWKLDVGTTRLQSLASHF
jgi:tRNA-dihydrouridine synthase